MQIDQQPQQEAGLNLHKSIQNEPLQHGILSFRQRSNKAYLKAGGILQNIFVEDADPTPNLKGSGTWHFFNLLLCLRCTRNGINPNLAILSPRLVYLVVLFLIALSVYMLGGSRWGESECMSFFIFTLTDVIYVLNRLIGCSYIGFLLLQLFCWFWFLLKETL